MKIKLTDNQEWHTWFAWRPVRANGSIYWLEKVKRKLIPNGLDWAWIYEEIR